MNKNRRSGAQVRADAQSPEEQKAAEIDRLLKDADAKKRADADAGTMPDKLLKALETIGTRLDSMCGRMDAFETKDKERADAEAKAKADAEKAEHTKTPSDDETEVSRAALADAQARADSVASVFGSSAPRPLDGETLIAYRRRLLKPYQHHSKDFSGVDLAVVTDQKIFKGIEDRIYADAVAAGAVPDVPVGRLLERVTTDNSGRRISTFYGPQSYIHLMKRPGKRVVGFNTGRRSDYP